MSERLWKGETSLKVVLPSKRTGLEIVNALIAAIRLVKKPEKKWASMIEQVLREGTTGGLFGGRYPDTKCILPLAYDPPLQMNLFAPNKPIEVNCWLRVLQKAKMFKLFGPLRENWTNSDDALFLALETFTLEEIQNEIFFTVKVYRPFEEIREFLGTTEFSEIKTLNSPDLEEIIECFLKLL